MIRRMNKDSSTKQENKKVRNATETIVEGIKYRSKLEAYAAKLFKENNITVEYEENIFILQEKFEFTGKIYEPHKIGNQKDFIEVSNNIRTITYKPDFVNKDLKFIIEVKGYANDAFPIKWKMFKKIIKNEGYTLFLPSTQKQVKDTVRIIKEKFY